jgi:Zn ribbon nucleic-acid-binding protein
MKAQTKNIELVVCVVCLFSMRNEDNEKETTISNKTNSSKEN